MTKKSLSGLVGALTKEDLAFYETIVEPFLDIQDQAIHVFDNFDMRLAKMRDVLASHQDAILDNIDILYITIAVTDIALANLINKLEEIRKKLHVLAGPVFH